MSHVHLFRQRRHQRPEAARGGGGGAPGADRAQRQSRPFGPSRRAGGRADRAGRAGRAARAHGRSVVHADRLRPELHRRAEPGHQGLALPRRSRDLHDAGAQFRAAAAVRAGGAGAHRADAALPAPGRLRGSRRRARRAAPPHGAHRRDPRQQRHRRDSARGGHRPDRAAGGRALSHRRRAGAGRTAGERAGAEVRPLRLSRAQVPARASGHRRAVHSSGACAAHAARGRHGHRLRQHAPAEGAARALRVGHGESARNRRTGRGLRLRLPAPFDHSEPRAGAHGGALRGTDAHAGRDCLQPAGGGRAGGHRVVQSGRSFLLSGRRRVFPGGHRRARRAALRSGCPSLSRYDAPRRGARQRELRQHLRGSRTISPNSA